MRILKTGMKIGDLVLRMKIRGRATDSPAIRKKWRVECQCGAPDCLSKGGVTFVVPDMYLKRPGNPKDTCGAKNRTNKTRFNEEYRIWLMMHERTENETHVSYKDYGGRGILVCAEWNRSNPDGKGFDRFLEFVGPRPTPSHTIDRINNDHGYQPFHEGKVQVKWSTGAEQRANQRPRSSSGLTTAQAALTVITTSIIKGEAIIFDDMFVADTPEKKEQVRKWFEESCSGRKK